MGARPQPVRGRRAALIAILLGLAGCSAAVAESAESQGPEAATLMEDLMADRGSIGGEFSLADQHGRRAGTGQWRGKVVLLYFGDVSCPDACPTDLAAIGAAIAALGPQGRQVQPVFVTLDPLRDTADRIGPYAEHFHPRFLALRGSEADTRTIATAYKVYYARVPRGPAGDYAIEHSSFTYVLDEQGHYAGFFPPATTGSRIAERLRDMIHRQ